MAHIAIYFTLLQYLLVGIVLESVQILEMRDTV